MHELRAVAERVRIVGLDIDWRVALAHLPKRRLHNAIFPIKKCIMSKDLSGTGTQDARDQTVAQVRPRSSLEKNKSKYRLLDYTEGGEDEGLGLSGKVVQASGLRSEKATGTVAPPSLIDVLHRLLWLLEHKPPKIPEFLVDTQPNLEQLKLVCQALGGPALKGGELKDVSPTAEQSTLGKLLANWSAVMEGQAVVADRQKGQHRLL